jgi:hypothetical protein
MAAAGGGKFSNGRGDDPDFDEYFRRMCRGLRERTRSIPRPPELTEEQTGHRERVRMRALSLLGVMRPELRDLDSLDWGEALEKVCDAIIDLWICEECHEEGTRCTCLVDLWDDDLSRDGDDEGPGPRDFPHFGGGGYIGGGN